MAKMEDTRKAVKRSLSFFSPGSAGNDSSFIPDGEVTPPPEENDCMILDELNRTRHKMGDLTETGQTMEDSKEEEDADEEYEVEKILDYTREQGEDWYLVKWKGWSSEFNTWEPQSHLESCKNILLDFFKERELERQEAPPARKRRLIKPPDPRDSHQKVTDFIRSHFTPTKEEMNEIFAKSNVKGMLSLKTKLLPWRKLETRIVQYVDNPRSNNVLQELLKQLKYHEMKKKREQQLKKLKAWEAEINCINKEPASIHVENNINLEEPPDDFIYISNYLPTDDIIMPSEPPVGCECISCHPSSKKCCGHNAGSEYAYDRYHRLRIGFGTPVYECNKRCSCGEDCTNRVVQHGRKVKLCIFQTSSGCGWGVKTLENIKKNTFVCEYVGEVVSSEEAERRGEKYDADGQTYLFDLDYNDSELCPYTVDAAKYGNVSHFINHSCDPNLAVVAVWINCLDPNLPTLALFARKDISKGEEITFDYTSQVGKTAAAQDGDDPEATKGGNLSSPVITNLSQKSGKTPRRESRGLMRTRCKCGSSNCRQFLF